MLHTAADALVAARQAAHAGNLDEAVKRGAAARKDADQVSAALDAAGPGPTDESVLRFDLIADAVGLGQMAGLYTPDMDSAGGAELIDDPKALLYTTGLLGNVDAIAVHGQDGTGGVCPNLALALGTPLPTFIFAVPSAGPVPPGTAADQASAVLASLGLRPAEGIAYSLPASVPWFKASGGSVPDPSVLTNRTTKDIWYPFAATIRRWDGSHWVAAAECDPDTSAGNLCEVKDINAQSLGAGQRDTAFLAWGGGASLGTNLGLPAVAPGTYAIVVPIWRATLQPDSGTTIYPTTLPTEGVVAILTVTSPPCQPCSQP